MWTRIGNVLYGLLVLEVLLGFAFTRLLNTPGDIWQLPGLAFLPLWAGAVGLWRSWRARAAPWPGTPGRTRYNSALHCFCGGTLLWGIGSLISYRLIKIGQPYYPSLAEVAFVPGVLLWIAGGLALYPALKTDLVKEIGPFGTWFTGALALTLTVLFKTRADNAGDLDKLVFDIAYPSMSAAAWTTLGPIVLGNKYRELPDTWRLPMIFFTVGLFLMFLADIAFSITTALEFSNPELERFSYSSSGASSDAVYILAMVLLGAGIVLVTSNGHSRSLNKLSAPSPRVERM